MRFAFLAKRRRRREDLSAALSQDFGCGEEFGVEVERGSRARGQQSGAALAGDVGEAVGDVGPAGEDDALDPGADRRLRGAGISAAIEQRRALRRAKFRRMGVWLEDGVLVGEKEHDHDPAALPGE